MKLWQVIIVASTASVLGDQIGYGVARWGGRLLVARISHRMGWEVRILKAEAHAKRWGALGIFLSRWLVTPLGPWLNVTSGIAEYSWLRFFLWDALGNLFGVVMFVTLGYFFSGQVQAMADILGDLPWVILGFVVAVILGWKIVQYLRTPNTGAAAPA
jgi:membrane protein DedA with SNARE-associated domain